MSTLDAITAAIRDILHAWPADPDPDRPWPAGWCEVCGADDGQVLTLVHVDDAATIEAHPECGERRGYVLPARTGAAAEVTR